MHEVRENDKYVINDMSQLQIKRIKKFPKSMRQYVVFIQQISLKCFQLFFFPKHA